MRSPPYLLSDLDEIWETHKDVLQCYWHNDEVSAFVANDHPISGSIPTYGAAVLSIYCGYAHYAKNVPAPMLRYLYLAFYAAPYDDAYYRARFGVGATLGEQSAGAEWLVSVLSLLFLPSALAEFAKDQWLKDRLRVRLLERC